MRMNLALCVSAAFMAVCSVKPRFLLRPRARLLPACSVYPRFLLRSLSGHTSLDR